MHFPQVVLPLPAVLDLLDDQQHHRHHDQGEEGGEDQAVDHRPTEGAPEDHVVAAHVDVRVQLREEVGEVEIEPDGQRQQAAHCGESL